MSSAANYYTHFARRAWKHFRLRCSPARYMAWCRIVTDCEDGAHVQALARTHEETLSGRSVWRATLGGHTMRVVLDNETERLVTCMPWGKELDRLRTPPSRLKDTAARRRRERISY